ncbi:unnamed protein product [Triticum turgidum subsp. durum]|uniref:Casein kinase II subunit beta n=1 Tax=Triticum turgidum subsp. durum TaxID=4567 RepID=A0A9R0WWT5_TRITD|nr:unnamed protein product [Triticum turgidum subsp. durum]
MDRKRINDALDRHLRAATERSSPSTSRAAAKPKPPSAAAPKPKEQLDSDSSEGGSAGGPSEADDTFWINWFCAMRGNEFFAEVDDDYIQDDFNLCGLSAQVPYYDHALDLILDLEPVQGDVFADDQNELIVASAEMLYGLIHARYILTTKGLAAMLEKFKNCDFGRCPRVSCSGQPCLPMGQSDIPRETKVRERLELEREKVTIEAKRVTIKTKQVGLAKIIKESRIMLGNTSIMDDNVKEWFCIMQKDINAHHEY